MTRQGAACAVVTVLLLNCLFVAFALAARAVPPGPLVERLRAAFATGDLLDEDYSPFDSRRGYDLYSECVVFQMAINRSEDVWADAIAPRLYYQPTDNWVHQCEPLRRIVTSGANPSVFEPTRYTRYWFGFIPLATALLSAFDLATARQGLKLVLYGALALLAVIAGFRARALSAAAVAVAITGMLFWGIPYHGQTFCRAPADTIVVLGLCGLLAFRRRLSSLGKLLPYCAGYGACVAYLEALTGSLPTAAALLAALAYVVGVSTSNGDGASSHGWTHVLTALGAFTLGAALTIAIKQILVTITLGPDSFFLFLQTLSRRTSAVTSESPVVPVLLPFQALVSQRAVLTYGSVALADSLLAATALAWTAAAYLGVRRSDGRGLSDFAAFALGTVIIVAWVAVFQQHTFMHCAFMVRLLMAPIALGWAGLGWQLARHAGCDAGS